MRTGFLSPKLEVRMTPEKGGFAVFACQSVAKDELLAMWGGRVSLLEDVLALPREQQGHTIQIYDNLYLTPETMDEPADYVNHSCDPNCGLWGQVGLVAMRAIAPGEEITFDYAMADSSSFDEFECACGTPSCRGGWLAAIGRAASFGPVMMAIFRPIYSAKSIRCAVGLSRTGLTT